MQMRLHLWTNLNSIGTLYKQLLFLLIIFSVAVGVTNAQDFLPMLNDNYSGINQAPLQPAAIADSRFDRDFNLLGFNCDIYNDAMLFNSKWLRNPLSVLTNRGWWDKNTYLETPNGQAKNFFMSQSILGPGFLVSINEKHAVGFTYRLRSITNTDNLSEPLFRSVYSEYEDPQQWNKWYFVNKMRSVQHIFGDYALIYAAEIWKRGPHFMKIGGSVKFLQGIAAAYVQTDSLFFYYDENSGPTGHGISWNSPYVRGGLSGNWGYYDQSNNFDYSMNYQITDKPSVGFDIGLVYEYRPKFKQYMYNVDGRRYLVRKDRTKYMFKIGVSLLDVGRLKYKKMYNSFNMTVESTHNYIRKYYESDNSIPANTYWMDVRKSSFSFLEYAAFVDTLYNRYLNDQGVEKDVDDPGNFKVKLPTSFSLQVDFKIYRRIFVNMTTYTALNQAFNENPNSHYISLYSITPRFESKWITVAVPVQYNQYQKFNVGLGIRTPFFYMGVTNFLSAMFKDRYGLDIYFGVKLSVFKGRPRADVDNDIRAF
jgi:hypothetical protein